MSEEPRKYLQKEFCGAIPEEEFLDFIVHWFHATRVEDPNVFYREGIKPTSEVEQYLKNLITKLAQGLIKEGNNPFTQSMIGKGMCKAMCNDDGPCAFLIRTTAVEAPGATRDFTKGSEFLADNAGEVLGENFKQLVERFQAVTKPCIVEFRAHGKLRHFSHALQYIYLVEIGEPEIDAAEIASTCYTGKGCAVLSEYIITVEELSDVSLQRKRLS